MSEEMFIPVYAAPGEGRKVHVPIIYWATPDEIIRHMEAEMLDILPPRTISDGIWIERERDLSKVLINVLVWLRDKGDEPDLSVFKRFLARAKTSPLGWVQFLKDVRQEGIPPQLDSRIEQQLIELPGGPDNILDSTSTGILPLRICKWVSDQLPVEAVDLLKVLLALVKVCDSLDSPEQIEDELDEAHALLAKVSKRGVTDEAHAWLAKHFASNADRAATPYPILLTSQTAT